METYLIILFLALCATLMCSRTMRTRLKVTIALACDMYAYKTGIALYDGDPNFEKTVTAGVNKLLADNEEQGTQLTELQTQNKTLTDNFENLQKETKDAYKDLEMTKTSLTSLEEGMQKLKKIELQMNRERLMAFGDPMQRILASEENRLRINAEVRRLCDPRQQGVARSFLDRAEVKALQNDSGVGATYLTAALEREIYDLLERHGAWSTLGVRTVGTKTTKYPVQTARPIAKFIRRLAGRKLAVDANKAGTSVSVDVEAIGCLLLAELELLEDEEVDLTTNFLDDLVQALNYRIDHCVFVADGTDDADDGEIEGIFDAGTASVATSGATIAAMGYEGYLKATLAVDAEVLNRSPRWWMHQQQLVRSLGVKDSNGRPIFLTALEAPSAGSIGSLLGYPVTPVALAPNEDGASKKIAAFGDPQSYIVAMRKGVSLAQSDDYAFDEMSRAFRADARFGAGFRKSSGISILTTAAGGGG